MGGRASQGGTGGRGLRAAKVEGLATDRVGYLRRRALRLSAAHLSPGRRLGREDQGRSLEGSQNEGCRSRKDSARTGRGRAGGGCEEGRGEEGQGGGGGEETSRVGAKWSEEDKVRRRAGCSPFFLAPVLGLKLGMSSAKLQKLLAALNESTEWGQ